MTNTYELATEDMDDTATVHVFSEGGATKARISWPLVDRPSPLIDASVGRVLQVPDALFLVNEAMVKQTVSRVAIRLDDAALWDQQWGELR